jgi:polysaccharide pyruvyl transferase CsaB
MKGNLVIAGYYGFGNAGDELILLSLIQNAQASDPNADITVFSSEPAKTAGYFGVHAVDRRFPWQWVRPLMDANRFILGGGGLLQESSGPWNYIYYLSLLGIAKMFGAEAEIRALGVDSITWPWNRFLTRLVLHHCVDTVSVRDEGSQIALRQAGVQTPIEIECDPVFELAQVTGSKNRSGIALALSGAGAKIPGTRNLGLLCDRLASIRCTPIDLLVLFPAEDQALASEIASLSAAVRRVRVCEEPRDLLTWCKEYEVIGGSRFHALVLAAANGTPFFGWGEQSKVQSLCRKFGRPFWTPRTPWDLEEQIQMIQTLYKSSDKSVILTN